LVSDYEWPIKKGHLIAPPPQFNIVINYITINQSILRNNPADGYLCLFMAVVAVGTLRVRAYL
jgi:hypothetical protein